MRVSISSDGRFKMTSDSAIWTDGPLNYQSWSRYLSAFDSVNVVARVESISTMSANLRRADGPDVGFSPVPTFIGPAQYVLRSREVRRAARNAIAPDDAVILNVPGHIATCVEPVLANRPYAVHVISDCRDTFAPGVFKHPLRPFFRWWLSRNLRRQVFRATAALYVTRRALQDRYPCRGHMAGISDVDLPDEAFVAAPCRQFDGRGPITLLSIGTMATQFTKGHDVLIDAFAACRRQGLDLRLVLVGGGRFQPFYVERARKLGIQDWVTFRGQVAAGPEVRRELDSADLFVFPSRIEGLPRALVEAMARGLPCISTPVGGIPELLPPEDLTPVGCANALARKIQQVVSNPALRTEMLLRNLRTATDFRAETLRRQWDAFFLLLAEKTATWNASSRRRAPRHSAQTLSSQAH